MFELCLHCLARKRGLISATKVSVGFVLKWDSTSGVYQELHPTLLEIGKIHKEKTLNQESAVHCNIYRRDSHTSSVTANPGKV